MITVTCQRPMVQAPAYDPYGRNAVQWNKIKDIKSVRAATGWGLKEAKHFVEGQAMEMSAAQIRTLENNREFQCTLHYDGGASFEQFFNLLRNRSLDQVSFKVCVEGQELPFNVDDLATKIELLNFVMRSNRPTG